MPAPVYTIEQSLAPMNKPTSNKGVTYPPLLGFLHTHCYGINNHAIMSCTRLPGYCVLYSCHSFDHYVLIFNNGRHEVMVVWFNILSFMYAFVLFIYDRKPSCICPDGTVSKTLNTLNLYSHQTILYLTRNPGKMWLGYDMSNIRLILTQLDP